MEFFKFKGSFDRVVRRTTSLALALLIVLGCFLFTSGSPSDLQYEALEYEEPNVRVALTLESEGYTSYAFTTEKGVKFGYIDCNTDEFEIIGTTNTLSCRADLDNNYYIDLYGLKVGEEERNIRDAETLMLLESMLAG